MRYFVFQGNDHDCGFAALKMLLSRVHRSASYLDIPKPAQKRGYFSYRDLIDLAAAHGVRLVAYTLFDKSELVIVDGLPILAAIKTSSTNVHMIVIIKITRRKIIADDPARGRIVYRRHDFVKIWDGTFIKVEEVKAEAKSKRAPALLPRGRKATLAALQILSSTFVLTSFFFVSSEVYFVMPLLFFVLFIISELVYRRYLFCAMEGFDAKYLLSTYDIDKDKMRERYLRYHAFKQGFFISPQTIVVASIATLFTAFLLVYNDWRHLFFLASVLLYSSLDASILERSTDKRRRELERLEEGILRQAMTRSEAMTNFRVMSKASSEIAKRLMLRRYVALFLIGTCVLLACALLREMTLNFLLFHFFIYLLFYENVGKLFRASSQRGENGRSLSRFKDDFLN